MLDLTDNDGKGIARCTAADCGYEGPPTYLEGKAQRNCPVCEKPDLDKIAEEIEHENRPKVARNAPCPCGSGVKGKKCCYR